MKPCHPKPKEKCGGTHSQYKKAKTPSRGVSYISMNDITEN